MASHYDLLKTQVKKGNQVFIAHDAVVIGNVVLKDYANIWYKSVLRGDRDLIEIGKRTNIQDLSMLHCDPGVVCKIGDECTVGHASLIHGAIVQDHCLIGMRSTLMNHVEIGHHSIVGAGSLVTEGKKFPPYSLIMGSPAKKIRELQPEEIERALSGVQSYVIMAASYLA